ncbi:cell growth regulator with RING finger domain protein 1 [Cynoglossus semilaevis]|uniref:Cell growth regulator with RING finger domain protein 1 n=1 Tax=Cynoglossus semilaevis TaxID=244447 RepID=A0A3P8WCG2_CYNSE|nr:cell growth regulator with RING finger domain protein 1 [Cynoglossus semilaevis]
MAAVFLITLYEYSPLFHISVVSLCFLVTAAVVLGWFGFDVPVILRSSDTEIALPTPEKQMVHVSNPLTLELGLNPASVTDGASLKPWCLEPCILSCFWGCDIIALQAALQKHQHGLRLSTPEQFQRALHLRYHHCQTFFVRREDSREYHTRIPSDQGITDFGPMPRYCYPLVAVLMLAEGEAMDTYNIEAHVTVIHVPDDKYNLSARVLFQYLLTLQGNMYELKPLFMSADSWMLSGAPDPDTSNTQSKPKEEEDPCAEQRPVDEEEAKDEEEWEEEEEKEEEGGGLSEGSERDCVVCQNAAVNRVLLPCRHTCVCDGCVSHFQHCPICRAFVFESFALTPGAACG